VEEWRRSGAEALYSGFNVIDDKGVLIEEKPIPTARNDPSPYFLGGRVEQISGASAAYTRRMFEAVRMPKVPVMAEDYFFSLILGLRGCKVAAIHEALIDYRLHKGALSHTPESLVGIEAFERQVAKNANWGFQLLELLEQYAADPALIDSTWGYPRNIAAEQVRADKALSAYQANWLNASFLSRLAALIRFRRHRHRRWIAARLFGLSGLVAVKKARAIVRRERPSE
jgi:hypothetical protein